MSQLSRDNHFVSQAYLRAWSSDGVTVQAYRTLVSDCRVPEWTSRVIRGVAFRRDLYTRVDNDGNEHDDIERLLADEIEAPALAAIDKVIKGRRLLPADWEHMALFFAAQDLRTPLNFIHCMERWRDELPQLLQDTLRESIEKLKRATLDGVDLPLPDPAAEHESPAGLDVWIQEDGHGNKQLHASLMLGRRVWLQEMKRLLAGIAQGLRQHKWSVARPAEGFEWVTSDHPALKLNYHGPDTYDFKGGWGSHGTELMLPLSPRHLLYTQIGKKAAPRFEFSSDKTSELQKILAERAHRWIFSRLPIPEIGSFRPRVVDSIAFAAEEKAWEEWHKTQSAAETEA